MAVDNGVFVIHGNRGAGKSTTLAAFKEAYEGTGYKVFTQYPIKGTYQIPMVQKKIGNVYRSVVDKEWLYSHKFPYSLILIDEGKNVWPNRDWSKWTQADDDFFDFVRKNHCVIVIATLAYDQIDVNVKRASDVLMFINKWFWHFSKVECSYSQIAPVSDKQKEVIGFANKKGMHKVNYEIVEVPCGSFNLWRRSFYDKFKTEYVVDEKPEPQLVPWDDEIFKLK